MSELRVGIVVPSLNGARFLRECIDSILAQHYAALTCVVRDGGSSDESIEILKSYGARIEWTSERDNGQADAIDKGFSRLDGCDLVGWLNSDDVLLPHAVDSVARAARAHPTAVLFHGDVVRIDAEGTRIGTTRSMNIDYETMRRGDGRTVQPGSFYRSWAVREVGGLDSKFHLLMDVDLWIRLLSKGPAVRIPEELAQFRVHAAAKSSAAPSRYYRETLRLGFLHERDRIVRATLRRALRIGMNYLRFQVRELGARPGGARRGSECAGG